MSRLFLVAFEDISGRHNIRPSSRAVNTTSSRQLQAPSSGSREIAAIFRKRLNLKSGESGLRDLGLAFEMGKSCRSDRSKRRSGGILPLLPAVTRRSPGVPQPPPAAKYFASGGAVSAALASPYSAGFLPPKLLRVTSPSPPMDPKRDVSCRTDSCQTP